MLQTTQKSKCHEALWTITPSDLSLPAVPCDPRSVRKACVLCFTTQSLFDDDVVFDFFLPVVQVLDMVRSLQNSRQSAFLGSNPLFVINGVVVRNELPILSTCPLHISIWVWQREAHINWSMVICRGSNRRLELPSELLALCRRTLGSEHHRYAIIIVA